MPINTPNYGLVKPDETEFYDVEVSNGNMDIIDTQLKLVSEKVEGITIPDASLIVAGKVMLSNATNGSRENVAPTEKALGLVMKEATAGKQAGIERKNETVAALNSIGIPSTTNETWAQLIPKIAAVIRATGAATAADVLAGVTASNKNGPFVGTMAKRVGAYQGTTMIGVASVTQGVIDVMPYKGYWDGATYGGISDPNFHPAYWRSDVKMFGKQGTMPVRNPDMADQIYASSVVYGPGSLYMGIPNAHYLNGINWAYLSEPNLNPNNVRAGVPMFNGQLVGTLIEGKKFFYGEYTGDTMVDINIGFNWQIIQIQSSLLDGAYTVYRYDPPTGKFSYNSGGSYSPALYNVTNTSFSLQPYGPGGVYRIYVYERK
ncbi:hypothetical protein ACP8HI_04545 [Paenibacillus sp. FA6]|uniref:hypothetical protein n=1 Tax=Paenibacillus sp. FA6 TaxID=3413029 RepID=UPI003F65676B